MIVAALNRSRQPLAVHSRPIAIPSSSGTSPHTSASLTASAIRTNVEEASAVITVSATIDATGVTLPAMLTAAPAATLIQAR